MDMNKLVALLPDIATFVIVVEQGSFSGAAKKLNVAPSSVSRSITRLEAAFETKLLERTTRRLGLSLAGKDVFELSKDMLQSVKLAAAAAKNQNEEPSGLLRIAAPKALSQWVLAPIILRFMKVYPKIEIRFQANDRVPDPIVDEVDVILQLTHQPIEGLVSRKLTTTRSCICATPAYLERAGTPEIPMDLMQHNCIGLGEDDSDRRWVFQKAKQQQQVTIQGQLSTNHSDIRKQAVLDHQGIAVFPDFVVRDALHKQELVEVLPQWQLIGKYQGDFVAQYAYSRFIPNQIRVFVDYLVAHFAARH